MMRDAFAILVGFCLVALSLASWLAHLVYTWTYDMLGLFLLGMVFPPVGIVHGFLVLIGVV